MFSNVFLQNWLRYHKSKDPTLEHITRIKFTEDEKRELVKLYNEEKRPSDVKIQSIADEFGRTFQQIIVSKKSF